MRCVHPGWSCGRNGATMPALANPMLPQTGQTSRPARSAFNRAGPLELQTHQKCPPRRISPLECALTQKRACKSFGMRTYKSLDLKSPGINTYKKHRGVGGLPVLQTLDLIPIFHCEGRIKRAQFRASIFVLNCFGLSRSFAASQAGREHTRISPRGRGWSTGRSAGMQGDANQFRRRLRGPGPGRGPRASRWSSGQ